MNEIERRELKGLDGWLVLFQIQIIGMLAGGAMSCVIFPIIIAIQNNIGGGVNVFAMYGEAFLPAYLTYVAVSFVLSLLCVIFFYRRKMVFRTIFVALSGVAVLFMVLYYIFGISQMFAFMGTGDEFDYIFSTIMRVFMGFTMLASIAPLVAIDIALFKSYRVKNTFS